MALTVCKQLWLNSLRAARSEDGWPPRCVTVAEEMQIHSVRLEGGGFVGMLQTHVGCGGRRGGGCCGEFWGFGRLIPGKKKKKKSREN